MKLVMNIVKMNVVMLVLVGTAYGAIGDVWDVGDDYSDQNNPNGAWSYRARIDHSLLCATQQVWGVTPDAWSINCIMGGAWYFWPELGQFSAEPNDDFVTSGDGGGLELRWTSPVDGWVQISGSLWGIWGATTAELLFNGVLIHSIAAPGGNLPGNDRFDFGGGLMMYSVVSGDIIDFDVLGGSGGTYMIEQVAAPPQVNLTVNTDPVQVDTVTPSSGLVPVDAIVQLTASRDSDPCPEVWEFDHWTGDVPGGQENDNPLMITMDVAKTLTAVFVDARACPDECHAIVAEDFDGNCRVDIIDFGQFASVYMNCTHPDCD
jgi:hypothetical protein